MTLSIPGARFIQTMEGLRLVVYADSAGHPTVGYGHKDDSLPIGATFTPEECADFFTTDIQSTERCVNSAVTETMAQNEFDAFVSLAFNIGCGNFRSSTIPKRFNQGDIKGAASAWTDPEFIWNKSGGKINNGLTNRRKAERILFLGGS